MAPSWGFFLAFFQAACGLRYIDAMSAVMPKTPKASPSRVKLLDPAAANAAAASFAVLEAQLGYLNETDTDMVRRAYKFADEAH
jgi:GTP diphosphokinase / guanosine-3',5'-bis(diphosphate) 3'-diphosphatase